MTPTALHFTNFQATFGKVWVKISYHCGNKIFTGNAVKRASLLKTASKVSQDILVTLDWRPWPLLYCFFFYNGIQRISLQWIINLIPRPISTKAGRGMMDGRSHPLSSHQGSPETSWLHLPGLFFLFTMRNKPHPKANLHRGSRVEPCT